MAFLKNSFALFTGLLAAFLIGEICCRYILPISTVCYYYDRDIGTTLAPERRMRWTNRLDYDNWVETNSAGFHDIEHAVKKDKNTYRILVLGDSFMEALQLPISEGFSKQLEMNLKQEVKDRKIEIINMGLSGRGPSQYYRILEKKGLQYNPDLVVMAILPSNDFSDCYQKFSNYSYKPYYKVNPAGNVELIPFFIPPWYSLKSLLTRSSMAYFFAYEILKRPAATELFIKIGLLPSINVNNKEIKDSKEAYLPFSYGLYLENQNREWLEAYDITLRMIKESRDLSKANGSGFIAFAIPDILTVEGKASAVKETYKSFSLNFGKPFDAIEAYCEKFEIPFVNLTPFFKVDYQQNKVSHSWKHDGHWNERGHRLGARIMCEPVAKIIAAQN